VPRSCSCARMLGGSPDHHLIPGGDVDRQRQQFATEPTGSPMPRQGLSRSGMGVSVSKSRPSLTISVGVFGFVRSDAGCVPEQHRHCTRKNWLGAAKMEGIPQILQFPVVIERRGPFAFEL
jgi:hypothetical protein